MKRPPFEIWEHTADAGVIARGATLEETFANAAAGMYALMVDLSGVRERETREVAAEGDQPERLLVNWLLELLFLTDVENLVFRRFDVTIEDGRLRGHAYGEPLDPERHTLGSAVKAVTRHGLEIAREDGGYRVRVLFDL
ncbi:MAG TPA: archease [Dehalococcoidia bacterium]|nr:archease [Dehalococcoidia bacterium]